MVRPEDDVQRLSRVPVRLVTGRVEDPAVLAAAAKDAHAVVNCAALLPNAAHLGMDAFHRVNVDGALNVLRQARASGATRAVFFSTISVVDHVGRCITSREVDEYVDGGSDPYLVSKIEMERALRREAEGFPGQVRVLRPSFIYGPGNFAAWEDAFALLEKRKMRLPGDGHALLPLIYAEDLAAFVQQVLVEIQSRPHYGMHVVSSPQRTTMADVFDHLADALGVARPRRVSASLLEAAARVVDRLPGALRRGRLRLLTRARVRQYTRGYDLSGVLDPPPLGFVAPTDYRVGLGRMVEDYRRRRAGEDAQA
jgi:nucleoside-diphosphate-sugar epimerase